MDKVEVICPNCKTSIYIGEEVLKIDNYIQCYICGAIFRNKYKDE